MHSLSNNKADNSSTEPLLIWPSTLSIGSSGIGALAPIQGPKGSLANFLKDLGPALLEKYSPKAIVVFSAHFETGKENLVTDYGDDNPLLMDCESLLALTNRSEAGLTLSTSPPTVFGFPDELYQTKFKSAGDHALSERIVNLLKESKIPARLTTKLEKRGQDGRGFEGPGFGTCGHDRLGCERVGLTADLYCRPWSLRSFHQDVWRQIPDSHCTGESQSLH